MANRTTSTPKKRETFLAAIAETGNVSLACKKAGVPRRTAYEWKQSDTQFSEAWDEAVEAGTDSLVQEAVRRAHAGVDEPVYYQGEICGTVRKYSDTLLIFLLKSHRPSVYKESVDLNHGGKVAIEYVNDWRASPQS